MLRSRKEELLYATWYGIKNLVVRSIAMLIIAIVMPFSFVLMLSLIRHMNAITLTPVFFPNSIILLFPAILCCLMSSMGIISTICHIKDRMDTYDTHANKEWSEKDLDQWCYCDLMTQYKISMHKNDPKFFIHNEK